MVLCLYEMLLFLQDCKWGMDMKSALDVESQSQFLLLLIGITTELLNNNIGKLSHHLSVFPNLLILYVQVICICLVYMN